MRVLVVDSNVVFAKTVREFLYRHVRDISVDLANNLPVMQRRIQTSHYDFIIADILATLDSDLMFRELRESHIPVVIWTAIQNLDDVLSTRSDLRNMFIHKPETEDGLQEALSPVVMACAAGTTSR